MPYLGVAAGVTAGVTAGVAAGASVGSPVVPPGVVVPVPPPPPPPSQAPRTVARLNITAKPKIFVFITPLSPIVARTIFHLLNTIPYLLLFFNIGRLHT
jgi:hypothetical protein